MQNTKNFFSLSDLFALDYNLNQIDNMLAAKVLEIVYKSGKIHFKSNVVPQEDELEEII